MLGTIKRELRIAFSKRGQPIWFRIVKWIVFAGLVIAFFDSPLFWYWVMGLLLLGVLGHLFYRHQTHGWKRPWGGWNDLDAGQ
jgi:hypothetical protein